MRLGIDLRQLQCTQRDSSLRRIVSNLLFQLADSEEEKWLFYLDEDSLINGKLNLAGYNYMPLPLPLGRRGYAARVTTDLIMPMRIRQLGLDVMLFAESFDEEIADAIPAWVPCPYIVVLHELDALFFGEASRRLAHPRRKRQLALLRNAKAIVTSSEFNRRNAAKRLGIPLEKITVIHPGANANFHPVVDINELCRVWRTLNVTPPYFLAFGDECKNLPVTLRAFARVCRGSAANHSLVIAGERLACSEVAQMIIEQSGLTDKIVFTGTVSDKELCALYSGAQALVYPAQNESFGLPVLEAMTCGTPVICARAGSLPEIAREAALYIDPSNAEDIAEQMQHLIREPSFCRSMSARSKERAANFSWRTTVNGIIELCYQVAALPGRRWPEQSNANPV